MMIDGVDSRTVGRSVQKVSREVAPGVTEEMVRTSVLQLKEKMLEKYKRLDTAFKAVDEDRSGYLSRDEFRFFLRILNLDCLNANVINALCTMMDKDGDGMINHFEFVSMLTSEDPFNVDMTMYTK